MKTLISILVLLISFSIKAQENIEDKEKIKVIEEFLAAIEFNNLDWEFKPKNEKDCNNQLDKLVYQKSIYSSLFVSGLEQIGSKIALNIKKELESWLLEYTLLLEHTLGLTSEKPTLEVLSSLYDNAYSMYEYGSKLNLSCQELSISTKLKEKFDMWDSDMSFFLEFTEEALNYFTQTKQGTQCQIEAETIYNEFDEYDFIFDEIPSFNRYVDAGEHLKKIDEIEKNMKFMRDRLVEVYPKIQALYKKAEALYSDCAPGYDIIVPEGLTRYEDSYDMFLVRLYDYLTITNIQKNKLEKGIQDIEQTKKRIAKLNEQEIEERDKPKPAGSGSGFLVTSQGHIITNSHVVNQCDEMKVFFKNSMHNAKILAENTSYDLAILKIDKTTPQYAKFSEKDGQLGEDVLVFGYPFGKHLSSYIKVTKGIVSSLTGLNNDLSLLQIDAAIQPGNSGGPIYNLKGEVIGVTVASIDKAVFFKEFELIPENINFGIKNSIAKIFLEANNLDFEPSDNTTKLESQQVAKIGNENTVYIECWMPVAKMRELRGSNNLVDFNLN